uniref:Uncharacterized protein n=1 Tax=Arundo donax TaxID=35708 RepID=A0A0A9BYK9_ARUDO
MVNIVVESEITGGYKY